MAELLYHGTTAHLAPAIARDGLMPNSGYVWLSSTPGLAWAFGVWSTGMLEANGLPRKLAFSTGPLITDPLSIAILKAWESAPTAAVAVIDKTYVPGLEGPMQAGCAAVPWEAEIRAAAGFRTRRAIPASAIVEWRIYPTDELNDPAHLAEMGRQSEELAELYPRGAALLEDLTPDPVGSAIPNGRRLLAAVLDAAGPASELDHHGVPHWARVAARGLRLLGEGADATVVLLFALLHDAARERDGSDPGHGARAAALALELQGEAFTLTSTQLDLLAYACHYHADGLVSDDRTIGACWDADRLDLGRYGTRARPELMSTEAGRVMTGARIEPVTVSLRDTLDAYAQLIAC